MQGTRKIVYGSVSGINGPQTIFSSAETWGELKSENPTLAAASAGMTAIVVNASKLSSDSDKLPEADFQLYLVLDKNNSGRGND